ncbi:hypothetical protein [Micromonospora sp. NPDC049204]|uniref:hypothetical protein n=1 Tax=Micromonospora sp. NPDC049204 TaxID=3154351 RepID=UPI0033EE1B71
MGHEYHQQDYQLLGVQTMIVSVLSAKLNGNIEVVKEIVNNLGVAKFNHRRFPTDTASIRVTEYGLADITEGLDMVLYEPHVNNSDEGLTHWDRIVACKERIAPEAVLTPEEIRLKFETVGISEDCYPADGTDPVTTILGMCTIASLGE